jgi:hypothetical protein
MSETGNPPESFCLINSGMIGLRTIAILLAEVELRA